MEATLTTIFFILLLLLIGYILYRWLRRPFDTLKSWNVPYETPYPLIGHYRPNLGRAEQRALAKFRGHQAYGLVLFRLPFMVLIDSWTIQQVAIKEFQHFTNRGVSAINPRPMNHSLFSLADGHWRHVRAVVSPVFSTGKLRSMFPLLHQAAQNAINHLKTRPHPSQPIKAREFYKHYVMDAIGSSLFGMDVNAHKNHDHPLVRHALNSFNTTLTNPVLFLTVLFPEYMNHFTNIGSAMLNREAMDYFKSTTDYLLYERNNTNQEYHDFLGTIAKAEVSKTEKKTKNFLGQIYEWSEQGLTRDEIFGQAVAFMAAGFEATSWSLIMLSYCLAKNPTIQEKLHVEISSILGDSDPTYASLNEMLYLDMCIKESMRLYPPNHSTERLCTKTVQIGDLIIPEGTMVLFPFYALGTDPTAWENAEEFIPERFMHENARKLYLSIPFGAGPRECIGKRLAYVEMKLIMAKIIQNFRIEPVETRPLKITYMGFLTVDPPIQLKFVER